MRVASAALFVLLAACNRGKSSSSGEQPAPSSSVITLGMAIGTCPDVVACERECDAGSADRCRRLAATYAFGEGVTQDETRAVGLYQHACEMGDATACLFAGQAHEYAHGVAKDDAKAEKLYARSCDMGWAPGCFNEGIMYERGTGVPQDRAKAADLYQLACTAGSKTACEKANAMHAPPVPFFFDGGLP